MGMMRDVAAWLGFATRSDDAAPAKIMPPRRAVTMNAETAMMISTVYRAVEVLAVGVSQLGLDQWRGPNRIVPSALVQRPDVSCHRPAFLETTTVSLALDGNAYWRVLRAPDGTPVSLQTLNPTEVHPALNERGEKVFHWRGTQYRAADRTSGDIMHLEKLRIPGRTKGLGPIEAARHELTGAIQASDYASSWFERGDVPSGLLVTDQELSPAQAKAYKDMWRGWNPVTEKYEPEGVGVRVLGMGLSYDPMQIKPADLQFLETQQFNTTQIARLFGTPASLMLAVVEGNSQSYSNVEQDWIAFTRFTLMSYLREIEEALSSLLPYGNTVRFNVDALQRSDTKTRYEGHAIAIEAGFLTIPEVRAIEGLEPLTAAESPTPVEALNND